MYLYREYFMAKVYTVWVHGPLGIAKVLLGILGIGSLLLKRPPLKSCNLISRLPPDPPSQAWNPSTKPQTPNPKPYKPYTRDPINPKPYKPISPINPINPINPPNPKPYKPYKPFTLKVETPRLQSLERHSPEPKLLSQTLGAESSSGA